jgi:hypothetical protein
VDALPHGRRPTARKKGSAMRDGKQYDGFLDHGGKTGREWLAEFRADASLIVDALDTWYEAAVTITYGAMDCNFRAYPKTPACFNAM